MRLQKEQKVYFVKGSYEKSIFLMKTQAFDHEMNNTLKDLWTIGHLVKFFHLTILTIE